MCSFVIFSAANKLERHILRVSLLSDGLALHSGASGERTPPLAEEPGYMKNRAKLVVIPSLFLMFHTLL